MCPEALTKPIVVAVDGSPNSDAAVEWSARESVLRNAHVQLIHVIAPMPQPWAAPADDSSTVDRWYRDRANTILTAAEAKFRAALGQSSVPDVGATILETPVVPTLIDASARAQLIVVGSRGLGTVGRLLLGSTSTGLIHHARCPVAVIPLDETHSTTAQQPVLLGVDGTTASDEATALAFDEAARRGADLLALHAWSDVGIPPRVAPDGWYDREKEASALLVENLNRWQEKYPGVHVDRRVVCDVPAHALIAESRYSQLVVVGSRGRGGFAGMLLGSVSSAVAHASSVPVIVVRGG